MPSLSASGASLGAYLKDRRLKLDPAAMGFPSARRRTPGLRREEVAQRAAISPTWYTWLEQGRGGAPSAEVLERIARALMLTEVEREHVFMLGLGRPPEPRSRPIDGVAPRLQRILDAMQGCPAVVRSATWDVVAWNAAAAAVLTDYGALPPRDRNVLRLMFLYPQAKAVQLDWDSVARFVIAVFRADATRAGAEAAMRALAEELSQASPEFAAMWRDNDVRGFSEGVKRIRHPVAGELGLEHSTFAVDGRTDLSMLVYSPATPRDAALIRSLVEAREKAAPLIETAPLEVIDG